jgi:hypothetical protein
MADAARCALSGENHGASDLIDNRGAVVICTAGALAMAAAVTVTVTMALSTGPTANASTSSSLAPDDQATRAQLVQLNPAVPLTDHEAGTRNAPRPALRDHDSLTAALVAGDARTDTAAMAANPVVKALPDETKLVPGFAQPKAVGKFLGHLAQELPVVQPKRENAQYAALGMAARSAGKSYSSSRLSGNISTGGKATSCLPSDLKRVLNEAAARFGHIRISSTHRSHSHNRRVGGAPRSMHLECRAVDFAYGGSRRGALIKFLRSHGDVGGLGVYGGSGHIHIDDGPHRTW